MAAIMAFGYDSIAHYVYSPTDTTHYGVVKEDGQKTEVYYAIQTANLEIRKWDHVYESFVNGYQGTAVVPGSHGISDIKLDFFQYGLLLDEIPEIKFAESSEYLLIGYFKDSNGNAGFMVTNASHPGENKNATVTMEFDEKYAGLQVYDKGEMDIIRLEDNQITFEIESSCGVFIIPLIAQQPDRDVDINKEITVSFDLNYNGSTAPETIKMKVGQPYGKLPSPPEREGYTFLGWRNGNTGFAKYVTADTVVELDIDHTLYAHWQGNPITLSFNLNGGTYYFKETIDDKTVIVDRPYGSIALPLTTILKREGYLFRGWYDNEDFSGPAIDPASRVNITTDHTLHAKWEPMKVYCDFEDPDDILLVYDKLGNLAPGAISIVERGEEGNHMLKIDSTGAALYDNLYTVVAVVFEGFSMKPGQYLSFDIQSNAGTFDALQIFDENDREFRRCQHLDRQVLSPYCDSENINNNCSASFGVHIIPSGFMVGRIRLDILY
jgi:uncharacterized repeat protein (TIGR02543 family)